MIQLTIDPSMISKKPGGDTGTAPSFCQLSVGITGSSLDQIPAAGTTYNDLRNWLFPWMLGTDLPTHLRIYWRFQNPGGGEQWFKDIPINYAIDKVVQAYKDDKVSLEKSYEALLEEKIYPAPTPPAAKEIKWNYVLENIGEPNRQIDVNETGIGSNDPTVNNGFLNAALAQFGQKLSPLNQLLNMVYYADGIDAFTIPVECTKFLVFPISEVVGSRWRLLESERPKVTEDGFGMLHYRGTGAQQMKIYCPVTPFPQGMDRDDAQPLKLRDEDGNFKGHVSVDAKDGEDWTPGVINRLGWFFELPRLIVNAVNDPRVAEPKIVRVYTGKSEDELGQYKRWVESIDDFLWASVRDASCLSPWIENAQTPTNFDMALTANGSGFLWHLVKQICDTQIGDLATLNETERVAYWTEFRKRYNKLAGLLPKADEKYKGIETWRNLIQWLAEADNADYKDTPYEWRDRINKLPDDVKTAVKQSNETLRKLWFGNIYNTDENKYEPLQPLEAENINEEVNKWFASWHTFVKLLEDTKIQSALLILQWQVVLTPELKEEELVRDIITAALEESVNTRALQKESIANTYRNRIFNTNETNETKRIEYIIDKTIASSISYVTTRGQKTSSSWSKRFYPLLANSPFPAVANMPAFGWAEFVAAYERWIRAQLAPDASAPKSDGTPLIEQLFPGAEKTYSAPPAVLLNVDSLINAPIGSSAEDDLTDEISGNIVLMRRATALNDSTYIGPWKCLNRALVKQSEIKKPFSKWYCIPSFIPETAGVKRAYLSLTNEKLSLIAGHDTFTDKHYSADINPHLTYLFDDRKVDEAGQKIEDVNADAFWYGYKYQLAGYVALNSGVLPEDLREDKAVWNLPAEKIKQISHNAIYEYAHLRRVPVSAVRISAKQRIKRKGSAGHTRIEIAEVKKMPKDFLSLASELDEWKGNDTDKPEEDKREEQLHFVLVNNHGETVEDSLFDFNQSEIELTVKRPTTDFWNWYAWVGEQAKQKDFTDATKSQAYAALLRDLEARDVAMVSGVKTGENLKDQLCDPAASNKVLVTVETLFPQKSSQQFEINLSSQGDPLDRPGTTYNYLEDPCKTLRIGFGLAPGEQDPNYITINEGEVKRVSVRAMVRKAYFEDSATSPLKAVKFHRWMMDKMGKDALYTGQDGKEYILSKPVETWFEGAKLLQPADNTGQILLWDNLAVLPDAQSNITAAIGRKEDYENLAYLSKIIVKHQVWSWNGRLDESEQLAKLSNDALDPKDNLTTAAMLWEAWAFADRPDFSAMEHVAFLRAWRPVGQNGGPQAAPDTQQLFVDRRPGEQKALYYRFSVRAFSRYALLGAPFNTLELDSEIKVYDNEKDKKDCKNYVNNKWRRHLRLSTKNQKLPKPSVRFVIPLTRSIAECRHETEIAPASVLIVLNDRWFAEAGLAEQLEVGIPTASTPDVPTSDYLYAGNDPVLSKNHLTPVQQSTTIVQTTATGQQSNSDVYLEDKGKEKIAVYSPKGPAGLTFDTGAQTPRLNGCAFILNIPDLTGLLQAGDDGDVFAGKKLKAWALMQIAVRRKLRPELCAVKEEAKLLHSEWTAREWVQFLPSTDAFVPTDWRQLVSNNGFVPVSTTGRPYFKAGAGLPQFDTIFEESMERYIIFTEKVYDMGGQPAEKYKGTYHVSNPGTNPVLQHNDGGKAPFVNAEEGYMRILLVRKPSQRAAQAAEDRNAAITAGGGSPVVEGTSIWSKLFGVFADGEQNMHTIQNDPTAALPLISERIPYKVS